MTTLLHKFVKINEEVTKEVTVNIGIESGSWHLVHIELCYVTRRPFNLSKVRVRFRAMVRVRVRVDHAYAMVSRVSRPDLFGSICSSETP